MPIRLLLVDDLVIFREGLNALFAAKGGFFVAGEAGNGHDAICQVAALPVDVVVIDIFLARLDGIEATAEMKQRGIKAKVVGLSACTDQRSIKRMLDAGAAGFVSKTQPFSELCRAIHATYSIQAYPIHGSSGPLRSTGEADPINTSKLSKHELQTLEYIATGRSSKEIASVLGVCLKTVEAHRRSLSQKLGRHGIAELTRCAIQMGLVHADA